MKVVCPNCDKGYRLADHLAGRRVRCKACQHVFVAEAEMAAVAVPAAVPVRREAEAVMVPEGPSSTPREHYDQLPWYRKGHIMAPLAVLGLFLCGIAWIPVVVAMWSGPIYYYTKQDATELKAWPDWHKYLFTGLLVILVIGWIVNIASGVTYGAAQ